ncbi:hypothetical protein [Nostoc sp. 'Peltigera membranacea cyanobiont' 213]|uniref:hypothetical protein n=1 Tax=Nostoc sp. 'Peltigera membranacea cyanobiont' 213 TaxID=2014530 RepID=UPI001CB92333|nr:hypothetical protein [Nostoc sp. 'Peltigera membranacea cyanobiont' 213]
MNLVVLLALVYITGEAWKLISAKPILTDTSVGWWGQTAIIAAAASLFFFDNTIVTTEEIRNWHPVSGFLNIFFAVFLKDKWIKIIFSIHFFIFNYQINIF